MALVLPKLVKLENRKLSALYYILLFSVGLGLAFRFFNLKQNSVSAVPHGRVTAWAEGHHDSDSAALEAAVAANNFTLCQNPGAYEYWSDVLGEHRQGPHECAPLCARQGARAAGSMCVRPAETYLKEASDTIFFVTEFSERYLDTESSSRHYLVPSVDALSLGFDYSFSIFDNGLFDASTVIGDEVFHSSSANILTVLIRKERTRRKYLVDQIIEPPHAVQLTMPKLVELAGRSLDVIQSESGANKKSGAAFPNGPLARVAGIEVNVHLFCHRTAGDVSGSIDLDLNTNWDGPVCLVEVRPSHEWWSSTEKVEVVESDGSLRKRTYHGVRVRFTVGGSFRYFDFNMAMLNLAACLLYMSLPAKFMLLVCMCCLGHLSTMYKQGICERCDLLEHCSGMAARLLSVSTSYQQLQDFCDDDYTGISRESVKEQLLSVFQYRNDIDEREVDRLVDFCIQVLVSHHDKQGQDDLIRLHKLLGRGSYDQIRHSLPEAAKPISTQAESHLSHQLRKKFSDGDLISVDDFTAAHASSEPFSFVSFLDLFDAHRKPTFVEKLFMPEDVRKCRKGKVLWKAKNPARRQPMCWLQRLCCCFSNSEAEEADIVAEEAKERKVIDVAPLDIVVIGRSDADSVHADAVQEPSPEPAATTYSPPLRPKISPAVQALGVRGTKHMSDRMEMVEATLRECQEQVLDALKGITTRLDRLEGGLTMHKQEIAVTKKKIDMLEALTGHHNTHELTAIPRTAGSVTDLNTMTALQRACSNSSVTESLASLSSFDKSFPKLRVEGAESPAQSRITSTSPSASMRFTSQQASTSYSSKLGSSIRTMLSSSPPPRRGLDAQPSHALPSAASRSPTRMVRATSSNLPAPPPATLQPQVETHSHYKKGSRVKRLPKGKVHRAASDMGDPEMEPENVDASWMYPQGSSSANAVPMRANSPTEEIDERPRKPAHSTQFDERSRNPFQPNSSSSSREARADERGYPVARNSKSPPKQDADSIFINSRPKNQPRKMPGKSASSNIHARRHPSPPIPSNLTGENEQPCLLEEELTF